MMNDCKTCGGSGLVVIATHGNGDVDKWPCSDCAKPTSNPVYEKESYFEMLYEEAIKERDEARALAKRYWGQVAAMKYKYTTAEPWMPALPWEQGK